MDKEVEQFCEQVGITLAQFRGDEVINKALSIKGISIIPANFKAQINGWLHIHEATIVRDGFAPTVDGNLVLFGKPIIGTNFAPVVEGVLSLDDTSEIGENFTPVVGQDLFIDNVTTVPRGFAPVVGHRLYMSQARTVDKDFRPAVGIELVIKNLSKVNENFAPVVGHHLLLKNVETLAPGFAPIVFGGLYLTSIDQDNIPSDFAPKVENKIWFKNNIKIKTELPQTLQVIERQGKKYGVAHGFLLEVVSSSSNFYKVKYIGTNKVFYLVVDDTRNFAYGETLDEAKDSLTYNISNCDTSKYRELSEDSVLTFEEAVKMYCSVTGACSQGVRRFIESMKIEKKNYTIREIFNLSTGQVGNDKLVKFFAL